MGEFHADIGVLKSIGRMNIEAGRRDRSGVGCACGKAKGVKVVGGDGWGAGAPGFGRLSLDLAHDGRAVVSVVTGRGEPGGFVGWGEYEGGWSRLGELLLPWTDVIKD